MSLLQISYPHACRLLELALNSLRTNYKSMGDEGILQPPTTRIIYLVALTAGFFLCRGGLLVKYPCLIALGWRILPRVWDCDIFKL